MVWGNEPPCCSLLVTPQLMQPVQLLAASFGVRDERELQSGRGENAFHLRTDLKRC